MYHIFRLRLLLVVFIFLMDLHVQAQTQRLPQLGAEIYLEPGQTPQQVEHWVKELSDNKMPIARVFMMWNYLEPKPGVWDFTLYDALFKTAEKYGVKITATLVPNSPPFFWGKDFFYITHIMRMYPKKEYRERSKSYIKKVVERYKNSSALDSWWLYNEPSGIPHVEKFAVDEFKKWLKTKYITVDSLNKSWQSYFPSFQEIAYDDLSQQGGWVWHTAFYDWCDFWRSHVIDQINWLSDEVKKYDKKHLFHTNPPGVFAALAHYDLPGMKKTINSLGTSMHPSWNFGLVPQRNFELVPRSKYGLAASWQNDLLYGVANEIPKVPYWISELQAGNNLYIMSPSPKDIAQWVWTSFGSGAERVIFWCLNSRMQGNESAEWALLDFQQDPSERMKKAAEIANIIQHNQNDFANAKPLTSPITVIISPQTLLIQERKEDNYSKIDAVKALAHQKAAMACYNALMQQGIPVQIKINTEYNWETKEKNQVVILADVRCLTTQDIKGIETFVRNGNKIIATGLTGLFDENEKTWVVNREFPLARTFGGSIQEIFSESEHFRIKLDEYKDSFPMQLWYSQILPGTGKVVGKYDGKSIAVRNNYGDGTVLWIPAMIDIGAWADNDNSLAQLLRKETELATKNIPFRFDALHKDCFMHTLKTAEGYITVIVNGNSNTEKIDIISSKTDRAKLLYGEGWDAAQHLLTIAPSETVVLKWE